MNILNQLVEILVFAIPTGYMLTSSGFSFIGLKYSRGAYSQS